MIIALDIFIAISVILGWLWYMKWKYSRDLKPSKKFPQGRMICEFWQETGTRRRELRGISENGEGIMEKDGSPSRATGKGKIKDDCYFFRKEHVGRTKYPLDPILNLTILQADASIVSWPEGIVEPINPWKTRRDQMTNPFISRRYVQGLRDQDRLASNRAISEEIEEAELKHQQKPLNPQYVYLLLIVAIAGACGAAIFAYQAFQVIQANFGG